MSPRLCVLTCRLDVEEEHVDTENRKFGFHSIIKCPFSFHSTLGGIPGSILHMSRVQPPLRPGTVRPPVADTQGGRRVPSALKATGAYTACRGKRENGDIICDAAQDGDSGKNSGRRVDLWAQRRQSS